jgi:ComF family protein
MRSDDRAMMLAKATMPRETGGDYRMLSNASNAKFDILRRRGGCAMRAFGRVLRAALPQACALCAAPSDAALLCDDCTHDMPRIAPACPRCALPSPDGSECGACLATPPPFAATVAAWRYAFPADKLLQAFKYGGRLALAAPLAVALEAAVRARDAPLPQHVIAMPLSPRRQRERGFNHAHEIARRVAARLDLPLVPGFRRTLDAPPQAGLTLNERVRNVRNAFVSPGLGGASVAIIDDVMTTGATLRAAALAAQAAGAARVEAWVVARTTRGPSGIRDRVSVSE